MDSAVVSATYQAAALSALSNLIGQALVCYRSHKPIAINYTDFSFFVLYAALSTPPNYKWQAWLERRFPAYTSDRTSGQSGPRPNGRTKSEKPMEAQKLNLRNTAIKFAFDQTLGASANTIVYIIGMSLMRGESFEMATRQVQLQFWPMIFAAQKLWPAVSILSFTVIPMEYRIVFGSTIGLFWGIYLSMTMVPKMG